MDQVAMLVGLMITSAGGILASVAGIISARRSGKVRDDVKPVSNGFADETKGFLGRIERRIDDLSQRQCATHEAVIKHLQDHASAHITRNREDRME